MRDPHGRVRIRLMSQADVMEFIHALSNCEARFSIENRSGIHRVNAKSVIGVMYTMFDFPDEMYLVNEDAAGDIPASVDRFRVQTA